MSNTSTVTPYESETSSDSAYAGSTTGSSTTGVAAGVVGVAALIRWLVEETDEDRAATERIKKERRLERLTRQPVSTVSLRLKQPDSLIVSAEKLGYRLESLNLPAGSPMEKSPILLRGRSGERLAITRNANGRIDISTAGDQGRIRNLVGQHTLAKTVEHLAKKGMSVQTATLANGEVQIVGRETDSARRGGAAEVKAQVRADGTTLIDIDCVRGNRCETIVSEFAEAIGGRVTGMTKKESYFQLPGEPTKTSVKV